MIKLFKKQIKTAIACRALCDQSNLISIGKAIEGWDLKLKDAGVSDTDFNIKCIVAHVLNQKFRSLNGNYKTKHFNQQQSKEFERLCTARCARMPLQHIIGEWDFMNLTLKTSPDVFIPRPETEEFVQKVIAAYRNERNVDMLEVGCGTGAMSLAILHALPQVRSTAIERSKTATELAKTNAQMLRLHDRFTVYHHKMEEDNFLPDQLKPKQYDLIISNPPYVRTNEFQYLHPEVIIYENINALDGGPDGLRVARVILNLACQHLKPKGKLWLELGADHPQLVKTIVCEKYADVLRFLSSYHDQYERERFVAIEKIATGNA